VSRWVTIKDGELSQLRIPIAEMWEFVALCNWQEVQHLLDEALDRERKSTLEERGLKVVDAEMWAKAVNGITSTSSHKLLILLARDPALAALGKAMDSKPKCMSDLKNGEWMLLEHPQTDHILYYRDEHGQLQVDPTIKDNQVDIVDHFYVQQMADYMFVKNMERAEQILREAKFVKGGTAP
jgi:hypothetical protein